MEKEKQKIVGLSWLVVSTQDYKKEYDWFFNKEDYCCYGILKEKLTGNVSRCLMEKYKTLNKPESFYDKCVLMPELQDLKIDEAAIFLRHWCDENGIIYKDNMDEYERTEAYYWGFDEF